MTYNLIYRAPGNEVMKANEHLTIEHLANIETTYFMHKNENENLPSVFRYLLDQNCTNIVKKIGHHLVKQKTILIIFQVIAESISQSNPLNIMAHYSEIGFLTYKRIKRLQKVSKQFKIQSILK